MNKNTIRKTTGWLLTVLLMLQIHTVAQWTKTGGPPGINVNVLYHNGNSLYAGTSAQGVFKSTNQGLNWSVANSGIKNKNVFAIIWDSTYLFAGTNKGVYRSSNNGNNWSRANTGIEQKFVTSFLNVNGFLYAGTSGGLFKSNDHGDNWTDASGGALGSSQIHAITFASPNLVVVADKLIFYSNDNGNSWYYPTTSPFILIGHSAFITHGDSILVSAGTNVYRSFDAGETWGNLININDSISISGLVESGSYIYAGTGWGMYKSKNFGKTWTRIPATGLRFGNRFFNHFAKSGSNFLLAFDELGVAYSSDKGATWNYSLNGFTIASSIDNALVYSNNSLYSGTHSDGVHKSINDGSSWSKIGTPDNSDSLSNSIVFALLKVNNNVILAGTCGYGLYRSADSGTTWTHITNGLPKQAGTGFLCVNSLAKSSTNILAGTDQGLYYSTNNGTSWHSTNISGNSFYVAGVAANGATACAAVQRLTEQNQIYRSVNKGVSWTSVFSVIDDFTTMASDGGNHFYAGSYATGYVSANNGSSWGSFGPGVSGGGAFAIAVKDNNVWVGNSEGVYFSNNNASSFSNANTGLNPVPNRAVEGFVISPVYIFAGTFINGVWKRPLSDFATSTLSAKYSTMNDLKIAITLNPVIHEGLLTYHVAKTSQVIIKLFDAAGRNMKILVNVKKEPGDYQARINSDTLPRGNYFALLVIGKVHTIIQFIVAK